MNDKQILESLVKKYGQAFILNELKRSTYRSAYSKALQQGRKKQASKFLDAYKNTPEDRYNFCLERGYDFSKFRFIKIMLDKKCIGFIIDWNDSDSNNVVIYDKYDNSIYNYLQKVSDEEYVPSDFVDLMDYFENYFTNKADARMFANLANEFIMTGYGKDHTYDWHHFAEL